MQKANFQQVLQHIGFTEGLAQVTGRVQPHTKTKIWVLTKWREPKVRSSLVDMLSKVFHILEISDRKKKKKVPSLILFLIVTQSKVDNLGDSINWQ